VAASLFGAGIWLLALEPLRMQGIYARGLAVAVSLITFGGYWLWVDFVAPALGIKVKE
jgi:hypothetical protein